MQFPLKSESYTLKIFHISELAHLSPAKRSYPTSEVRGSDLECQATMAQECPRRATLRPRSGAVAERSYPTSEVRGGSREETPRIQGRGGRPGGATPRPRSVAAGRRHPASEVRGSQEKPPRARGQGQQLGRATQGAVAAQAQESLEEVSHIEGQKRQW